jgi:hypothetical protein
LSATNRRLSFVSSRSLSHSTIQTHLELPQPRSVLSSRHRRVAAHRMPQRRRGVLLLRGGDGLLVPLHLLLVGLLLLLLLLLLVVVLIRRRVVPWRRRSACHRLVAAALVRQGEKAGTREEEREKGERGRSRWKSEGKKTTLIEELVYYFFRK